jgi:hypothetical protein
MKRHGWIAICGLALLTFSISCRKQVQVKGIEVAVDFSDKTLTDNLVTNIIYKWKTSSDFKPMSQDECIFVHFWHKSNMLLQDDYFPEIPTSKWEPNKEYTFTRRVYIPTFIDEFDPQFKGEDSLDLSVGLYSPYDRTGKAKFQILEKKLKVMPPPADTPEIVYEDGWFEPEVNPKTNVKLWRWTGKEARCLVDNPKRDAFFVIRGFVNQDAVKDQKVFIKINDTVLDEFIPPAGVFDKSYEIKKDMMGTKSEFRLILATDKTFVPAKLDPNSKDERELGIQVSFIYFR